MDADTMIGHANRLIDKLHVIENAHHEGYLPGLPSVEGLQAQVVDFFRNVASPRSPFVQSATRAEGADGYRANILVSLLESFVDHVQTGLLSGISPERRAQLDLVSDLLTQAQSLLEDPKVHPATPTVLIGAALEEFLRTWTESENLALGNRKPGLAAYAALLRQAELLQKQDVKDIESWGGLRNHAAHGEWADVSDSARVKLMLEGVNLFMRRYSP